MREIIRALIVAALSIPLVPLCTDIARATPTASGTVMPVRKTPAFVVLSDLTVPYNGSGQSVTMTTIPPGLQVMVTYGASSALPINVGMYAVRATISDPVYQGGTSGTMTIVPAKAAVTLTPLSLSAVYNHATVSATATTVPPGLPIVFTYRCNGALTAPVDAGTYSVTASVLSFNGTGSATGTLVIAPAPVTVSLGNLNAIFSGHPITATALTLPANLPISLTYNGIPNSPPTAIGIYTVVATVTNPNYAGTSTGMLVIAKPVSFATTFSPPVQEASGAWVSLGVNLGGVTTIAYFIFSSDPTFATSMRTPDQHLGNARTPTVVSAYFGQLQPNTIYYYELVTVSAAGTFTSNVQSFTSLGFDTTLVAATGQPSPGTASNFATFGSAAIDAFDGAAFYATLNKPSTTPSWAGIWANEGNLSLSLVAQIGGAAPGTGGALWATLADPVYDNETVAFGGTLVVSGAVTNATKSAVWSSSGGTLGLIARQGSVAPGTGGALFTTFNAVGLCDQGSVLLSATLADSLPQGVSLANNSGIWEGTTGTNLTLVLRTGQQTNLGKTIASFTFMPQESCVNGQTRSFGPTTGHLVANVVQTDRSTSIVKVLIPASPITVAASGNIAASTAGATFASFANATINDSDHVAFVATLKAGVGDATNANSTGIWADDSTGTRRLVARAGQIAPDAGNSAFAAFGDPVYNDHDAVAFYATCNGVGGNAGTHTGIWCNSTGATSLVALQGGAAPGCPAGVTFSSFTQMALDDVSGATQCGGTIIMATLTGPGITSANNTGIFAVDATGTLRLIVRTGDILIGKTITALTFLSSGTYLNGQTRSFSSSTGSLVYTATFSDRTQAIFNVVFP